MRKEDNELLVRVGPGTAMGQVFRSYWSPIADAKQLADKDSDPLRVRFCGEDYVASITAGSSPPTGNCSIRPIMAMRISRRASRRRAIRSARRAV